MTAAKQGQQNFQSMNENKKSIDAREIHKMLLLGYLQEKQASAIMNRPLIQALRYLQEKQNRSNHKAGGDLGLEGRCHSSNQEKVLFICINAS